MGVHCLAPVRLFAYREDSCLMPWQFARWTMNWTLDFCSWAYNKIPQQCTVVSPGTQVPPSLSPSLPPSLPLSLSPSLPPSLPPSLLPFPPPSSFLSFDLLPHLLMVMMYIEWLYNIQACFLQGKRGKSVAMAALVSFPDHPHLVPLGLGMRLYNIQVCFFYRKKWFIDC